MTLIIRSNLVEKEKELGVNTTFLVLSDPDFLEDIHQPEIIFNTNPNYIPYSFRWDFNEVEPTTPKLERTGYFTLVIDNDLVNEATGPQVVFYMQDLIESLKTKKIPKTDLWVRDEEFLEGITSRSNHYPGYFSGIGSHYLSFYRRPQASLSIEKTYDRLTGSLAEMTRKSRFFMTKRTTDLQSQVHYLETGKLPEKDGDWAICRLTTNPTLSHYHLKHSEFPVYAVVVSRDTLRGKTWKCVMKWTRFGKKPKIVSVSGESREDAIAKGIEKFKKFCRSYFEDIYTESCVLHKVLQNLED